jgi:hypothetical protein
VHDDRVDRLDEMDREADGRGFSASAACLMRIAATARSVRIGTLSDRRCTAAWRLATGLWLQQRTLYTLRPFGQPAEIA